MVFVKRKTSEIEIRDGSKLIEKTDSDGTFELTVNCESQDLAVLSKGCPKFVRPLNLTAFGYSIISDVDDTIKLSEVNNTGRLLHNFFFLPFKPIEGMNQFYKHLSQTLKVDSNSVGFHYVTAAMIEFNRPLQKFLQEHEFPEGSIHMSTPRISLSLLKFDITNYKTLSIEKIMDDFPYRQFILIGDSTQEDPEIYSKIAENHPEQIAGIIIRIVTGVNPKKEKYLNSEERFEKAFKNIPRSIWSLFYSANELF
jgi:phosphatidate phosphatase APP1